MTSPAPRITPADPPRLQSAKNSSARLLKLYARRTLPGDRDGLASWYRLRARLTPSVQVHVTRGPRPAGRPWLVAGVLTAALGLVVLAHGAPLPALSGATGGPAAPDSARSDALAAPRGRGPGGASGSRPSGRDSSNRGAGGMEGSSGARGSGGAA